LPSTTGSADLAARSLELARLQAQISQDWDALQQRPRRQFVGARTQEYRYARYVEDWRAKIERVGNLNYPDEARRQRVYGSLLLTVSIRRDGTVESIEINRSSGFRVLDQAAVRIVELAAPFAPFPPDIARDTDVLAITRTWSFSSGDQFQTQ
jgi:protein TonB